MNVFITGATGLVGSTLIPKLLKISPKVTALSRSPAKAQQLLGSQISIVSELSDLDFSQFDTVINLAGEPIFDKTWNAAQKQRLWQSRVDLTYQLTEKINQATQPPRIFISASAMGYYGDCGDELVTESHQAGQGFAAKLCAAWEQQALKANCRVCLLRTANILATQGGMLDKLLPIYKLGIAGKLGDGKQFMPWIHLQDMVNGIIYLLNHPNAQGAFNFTAPNAVQNQTFNRLLGQLLHRPSCLPVPKFALKLFFGERASLLLNSQNAVPQHLSEIGFQFEFATLKNALQNLL